MSDVAVNVEASRLMDHPSIAVRIKELTASVVARIQMSRAEWFSLVEKRIRFDIGKIFETFPTPTTQAFASRLLPSGLSFGQAYR